ncbi:hypothetical protein KM043_016240 [Ampulex compressa]|nr:hypothetical protein KM043_016240 [Ampulex compressa]
MPDNRGSSYKLIPTAHRDRPQACVRVQRPSSKFQSSMKRNVPEFDTEGTPLVAFSPWAASSKKGAGVTNVTGAAWPGQVVVLYAMDE